MFIKFGVIWSFGTFFCIFFTVNLSQQNIWPLESLKHTGINGTVCWCHFTYCLLLIFIYHSFTVEMETRLWCFSSSWWLFAYLLMKFLKHYVVTVAHRRVWLIAQLMGRIEGIWIIVVLIIPSCFPRETGFLILLYDVINKLSCKKTKQKKILPNPQMWLLILKNKICSLSMNQYY